MFTERSVGIQTQDLHLPPAPVLDSEKHNRQMEAELNEEAPTPGQEAAADNAEWIKHIMRSGKGRRLTTKDAFKFKFDILKATYFRWKQPISAFEAIASVGGLIEDEDLINNQSLWHLNISRKDIKPGAIVANLDGQYNDPGSWLVITPKQDTYIQRRIFLSQDEVFLEEHQEDPMAWLSTIQVAGAGD